MKAVHKRYVVLGPGQWTPESPGSTLIPTCLGTLNPLVVPYWNMCCLDWDPVPVPMVPEYEVDWHVGDDRQNDCKVKIQVYTREMQISLSIPSWNGYLHLQSSRIGYFLLLTGTIIELQALSKKGISQTTIHIDTNLLVKTIQKNM